MANFKRNRYKVLKGACLCPCYLNPLWVVLILFAGIFAELVNLVERCVEPRMCW